MMIIGCDFHPSFQQIAYVDQETGECGDRRLSHREEAVGFYGSLAGRKVVVGLEATGNDRWFTNDARSGPGPLHRYVVSGPRLRCFWAIVPLDVGLDYAMWAAITVKQKLRPTSERNHRPTSTGIRTLLAPFVEHLVPIERITIGL